MPRASVSTEPEQDARIVRRCIAAVAGDPPSRTRCVVEPHQAALRGFPRVGRQRDAEPVRAAGVVTVQAGAPAVVGDHDVGVAVVVEVAEGCATADLLEAHDGAACSLGITSTAVVQPELVGLPQRHAERTGRLSGDRGDGAVGAENVEVAVVVGVEPATAEAGERHARGCYAGGIGPVGEPAIAFIDVERIGLHREMRHEQIDVAIGIEVFGVDPHAGLHVAVAVDRDAGEESRVLEASATVVDPQQVVGHVVGDVDVEVAVVVEVLRDNAEGGTGLVDSRGGADVGEGAIAQVAEQAVACGRIDLGGAIAWLTFIAATRLVVRQAELDVVGDVEIAQAVAIEVREARTHGPVVAGERGGRRDVPESPVAEVLQQLVRSEVGEKDVDVAVVVDVAGGDPHAVARCTDSGGRGRIDEAKLAVPGHIPEQLVAGQGCRFWVGASDKGASLYEPDIKAAVTIEVEQSDAGAHDLHQPGLADHAVDVNELEAGGCGDVCEGLGRAGRGGERRQRNHGPRAGARALFGTHDRETRPSRLGVILLRHPALQSLAWCAPRLFACWVVWRCRLRQRSPCLFRRTIDPQSCPSWPQCAIRSPVGNTRPWQAKRKPLWRRSKRGRIATNPS